MPALSRDMDTPSKILFVVEGERTERLLVNRLSEVFEVSSEIFAVRGNIYKLYQAVKDDPFSGIVEVLSEMTDCESDKAILANVFTDVFLVFDCDAQHTMNPDEAHSMTAREIAVRNMGIVREMAERFDESTDPERGKLLVNYPMVESFRDCDDFFDMSYADAAVAVDSLRSYKNHVATRRLVRFHIKDYSPTNLSDLIRMNVFKLNKIVRGSFGACPYGEFLSINDQREIAKKESDLVRQDSVVSVLNTLLFFPLEYFGNANGFYDKVIEMP